MSKNLVAFTHGCYIEWPHTTQGRGVPRHHAAALMDRRLDIEVVMV